MGDATGPTRPGPLTPYVERMWAMPPGRPGPDRHSIPALHPPCTHATLDGPTGVRHGQLLPAALIHGVRTCRPGPVPTDPGWAAGLRFRPGGLTALTGMDAAALTDRTIRWDDPAAARALDQACAATGQPDRVGALAGWWLPLVPPAVDATYLVVRALTDDLERDRSLTGVEELAERHDLTVRSVQRLIRRYVGTPVTWLIRRYRLHNALETLRRDPDVDLSALAVDLGWYDQAHFTRDFRAAFGQPPRAFLRAEGTPRDAD